MRRWNAMPIGRRRPTDADPSTRDDLKCETLTSAVLVHSPLNTDKMANDVCCFLDTLNTVDGSASDFVLMSYEGEISLFLLKNDGYADTISRKILCTIKFGDS